MSYKIRLFCDSCGATSPESDTLKNARQIAEAGGWQTVRHLGQHLCNPCALSVSNEKVTPPRRRTQEDIMRESWAAKVARMKIALNLRRSGKTLRDVGDAIGVSSSRAKQLISHGEIAELNGWAHPNPRLEGFSPKA